ncbi:MAG TPA: ABC transporter transmembrane domain-containing protein [Blastocatellia bacterium]|jgi:subfamily B ATP-binding cassette protein MsbA|nr:ABC transporter transmembrane domain-containing protein [Blastocatellia bacterium]
MTEFSRLLRYLKPYRIIFAISVVLMVATGLFEGGMILLLQPIFDTISGDHSEGGVFSGLPFGRYLPTAGDIDLRGVAVLLVGLTLAKGVAEYFSSYFMSHIGQSVIADVRSSLYDHITRQAAPFFSRHPTNELTAHLMSDAALVERSVSDTLRDLLRESVSLVVYLALLFNFNWRLASAMLLLGPPIAWLVTNFNRRLRHYINSRQQSGAEMLDVAQESISSQRVVKAFGMEDYESRRFRDSARKQMRDQLRAMRIYFLSPIVLETVGVVAVAILLIYAQRSIKSGDMSLGEFAAFLVTMFKAYDPIRRLSRLQHDLQQGLTSSARIFRIMDEEVEMRDKPGAIALERFSRQIEFRDVSFRYGEGFDLPALEHVSFKVRAGETVAVVGQSGAGKSTLMNLIPRFYDVVEGAVLIDGRDARDLQIASLRRSIAVVTQETHLFNDTVRANIAYGSYGEGDGDEAVRRAARAALADDFIGKLPKGYNTIIGERGLILSGGQRQRLAIARAILKNAPILILDEATSALDAESEMLVQQALNNLMAGRTTIVIAHRLSTVRRADRIVVLEAGRVVEMGAHQELLRRDGVYRRLYELQFAEEEVAEIRRLTAGGTFSAD